jgi:hypothetical protein
MEFRPFYSRAQRFVFSRDSSTLSSSSSTINISPNETLERLKEELSYGVMQLVNYLHQIPVYSQLNEFDCQKIINENLFSLYCLTTDNL